MTRPVPLMFIKSPSTSIRYPVEQVESQSELPEEEVPEKFEKPHAEDKEINPSVEEQLKKIQTPFGRHLYQPLEFKLVDDSSVIGTVKEIEGGELTVLVGGNTEKILTVDAHEITDILWRGTSIKEQ